MLSRFAQYTVWLKSAKILDRPVCYTPNGLMCTTLFLAEAAQQLFIVLSIERAYRF